jgi:hypothetical protein
MFKIKTNKPVATNTIIKPLLPNTFFRTPKKVKSEGIPFGSNPIYLRKPVNKIQGRIKIAIKIKP